MGQGQQSYVLALSCFLYNSHRPSTGSGRMLTKSAMPIIIVSRGKPTRGKVTPFEGMTLRGHVTKTILRGKVIYDARDGIVAPPGYGHMLRRSTTRRPTADDRRSHITLRDPELPEIRS